MFETCNVVSICSSGHYAYKWIIGLVLVSPSIACRVKCWWKVDYTSSSSKFLILLQTPHESNQNLAKVLETVSCVVLTYRAGLAEVFVYVYFCVKWHKCSLKIFYSCWFILSGTKYTTISVSETFRKPFIFLIRCKASDSAGPTVQQHTLRRL
jgi:hypothetical protein